MKYLITGVAGLLGSRLADWLIENTDHEVVGVDDLSGGYIDNVNKDVEFYKSVSWHVHSLKELNTDFITYNCVRTRGRRDSVRRAYN